MRDSRYMKALALRDWEKFGVALHGAPDPEQDVSRCREKTVGEYRDSRKNLTRTISFASD